jgi:putative acetyltransferase
MIHIRLETPADIPHIRLVNERAFGQADEADIVDRLRRSDADMISLVADDGVGVVGHLLSTPAAVEAGGREVAGMALGPIAVLPDRQRQGIGSALITAAVEILRERGCPFVVLVGHPEYYPRFGFGRASEYQLTCQWPGVPDDAFMAVILDRNAMRSVSGTVRYRPEFDGGADGG